MLRLACLLLSFAGGSAPCAAATPTVAAPTATVEAPCHPARGDAEAADVAGARSSAAPGASGAPASSGPGASSGAPRVATPRWNRLLPGMFR